MKIYVNQGEIGDLKRMVRNRHEFLTFLHGINISQPNSKLEVTPIYMPLVRWDRHPHQIVVVFGYQLPVVMVTLQKKWPMIRVMILKEDQE